MLEELNKFFEYTMLGISAKEFLLPALIFFVIMFLRKLFAKIILKTIQKFTKKTKTTLDDKLFEIFAKPMEFSFIILAIFLSKETISLNKLNAFLDNILVSLIVFTVAWIGFNFLNEMKFIFSKFGDKFGKELAQDIENFLIKAAKVLIVIFAFIITAEHWGINVSAFVASLGLGGLAFALAAKDTAANLFGSLVIFTDRPFQIGDWIESDGIDGVVENIGIRSTNIRTFSKSLITIPNANLANAPINNWSRMNKRRIKMRLGLTYSTTKDQITNIIKEIKEMLNNHPDIHKDQIMVFFDKFEDSSLSLFCYYFTITTNWNEYLNVREDTNLKIMEIVEKNKASFAFPSQSVYLENTTSLPVK